MQIQLGLTNRRKIILDTVLILWWREGDVLLEPLTSDSMVVQSKG
jgi:hypothetical protein